MTPAKYEQVQKTMDTLLCDVTYSANIFSPSVAYTYARSSSLTGDIYKIFVNDKNPALAKFLYLHECGHIIFAHCKNMDIRMDKFLLAKIAAAFRKVENLFPNEQTFVKCFTDFLFNVVMDFEVNSRLFSKEEWDFFQDEIKTLVNQKDAKGFWPEDYGFEPGLTWNEYLNIILLDPKEFFTRYQFLKTISLAEAALNTVPQLTQEEYEKFKKEYADKKISDQMLESLKNDSKKNGESKFGIPLGQKGQSKNSINPVTIDFKTYTTKEQLVKAILKLLKIKTIPKLKRDMLYNENRRKFNTGVIIPKNLYTLRKINTNLFILIDVSGSVDASLVNDFVSTFKEIAANYKNTRVVYWTTNLIADWKITDPNPHKYGGGTNLSTGIDYVQEKYLPKQKDVFFVISDFCDNMNSWKNALTKMNCQKYAINWSTFSKDDNPGFKDIIHYNNK